ncbi:MAG: DUF2802 domain-containing protein [Gammaproteobacteria bacterium]|nr:DUF2802 domain-containing protein [Gammaproteobacteria bacterium]
MDELIQWLPQMQEFNQWLPQLSAAGLFGFAIIVYAFLYRFGRAQSLQQQAIMAAQNQVTLLEEKFSVLQLSHEKSAASEQWHKERLEKLELSNAATGPYNQAAQLAASGRGMDELIEACGLSRTEAELMVKLHRTH